MKRIISCLAIALGGCGGGNTNPDGAVPHPDLGSSQAEVCSSDGKPIALGAHYAIQARLNANVKVPGDCTDACLLDKDAKAGILLLADITQNGLAVTVKARACHIDIPPVALAGQPMPTQLTASDATVQSVGTLSSTATLSGANTCAALTTDKPLTIVLGAHLANPTGDALPTFSSMNTPPVKLCGGMAGVTCDKATDYGCICDQDGDGKAGATVGATGVPALDDVDKVYLALRSSFLLQGMVFPPSPGQATPGQRLKGMVAGLSLDQSPVGCHRQPGGGAMGFDCDVPTTNSVAKLNPRVSQSAHTASTFVALPVPDGYTCAMLVANAATLFQGQ